MHSGLTCFLSSVTTRDGGDSGGGNNQGCVHGFSRVSKETVTHSSSCVQSMSLLNSLSLCFHLCLHLQAPCHVPAYSRRGRSSYTPPTFSDSHPHPPTSFVRALHRHPYTPSSRARSILRFAYHAIIFLFLIPHQFMASACLLATAPERKQLEYHRGASTERWVQAQRRPCSAKFQCGWQ